MHRLDSKILDIEERIKSICLNCPKMEEASLQESLCAYAWILLDSWIAWRTLRFLLRDLSVGDEKLKKWFQTPSSYTANQLLAAWLFDDDIVLFIEGEVGSSINHIINQEVQGHRNSSAHFSENVLISGTDIYKIQKIYRTLSVAFFSTELDVFLGRIKEYASKDKMLIEDRGLISKCLTYSKKKLIDDSDAYLEFEVTSHTGKGYVIRINCDGCTIGLNDNSEEVDILDCSGNDFVFTLSKGYYLNGKRFYNGIIDAVKKYEKEYVSLN